MGQKLQFVWPKDGPKGKSGHRGFFGRLNNVLTNRGPDVFLQRSGSGEPIRPEEWGNWDSYHNWGSQMAENTGLVSRGVQRYDPHTRRYKTWAAPTDHHGFGVDGYGRGCYPRFTAMEWNKMSRRLDSGKEVNPRKMGSDWTHDGPKRFRQEHDWFWQDAHRISENRREGLHPHTGPNRNLQVHQQWPQDLNEWMVGEGLGMGPYRGQYRWP
ncbi:hypothetical protein BJ875DRAFT_64920 [Amylocarpus encephaloides]|uniref:Uncharacterized protein n=1 Tax=Amylocarpus encephaloides TaxID=45428 RepID=A0A9P8C468_9HELO|nr:hypothetical protein BJ875DRAFT_64920 [Amylocarpus encephaloides]